ncbi:hypothetical protein V7O66_01140 [Methanolobus sp. ZRKC3]|uniref:hypothetical protein n=1 Tax=Methanolobus sp. ZRKC3 TaxID=3125786 RepID=UPI00325342B6
MKKIVGILLIMTLLMIQPASADIFTDLELKVNEYNEVSDQVPSFINSLLGNEVIQLVIEMNDGTEVYIKAVTEESKITTFEKIEADTEIEATIVVGTNEDTVYEVLESDNPLNTFIDGMDSGNIVIEPVGFANSITFTVANVMLKVSKILGLI